MQHRRRRRKPYFTIPSGIYRFVLARLFTPTICSIFVYHVNVGRGVWLSINKIFRGFSFRGFASICDFFFFFSLENENYIQKTICTHCTFINNWRDEDDERITNIREDIYSVNDSFVFEFRKNDINIYKFMKRTRCKFSSIIRRTISPALPLSQISDLRLTLIARSILARG